MNLQGQRLADISLVAYPQQTSQRSGGRNVHTSSSNAAGRFRFDGLIQGDYVVRNEESPRYAISTINVRSGASEASLVLTEKRELWVHGSVKEGDTPLTGVSITPGGASANVTYSDTDGLFGLFVGLQGGDDGSDSLRFSLAGYSTERLALRIIDPFAPDLELPDVRLSRIRGLATVRGSISADDRPLGGAGVMLKSLQHSDHYETSSDPDGQFVISEVAFGTYTLTVNRAGNYKDHVANELQVAAAGLDLNISLEPLEDGRLRGQMVDINGDGVPGIIFLATSLNARGLGPYTLSGDAQGRFEVSNIPVGDLAMVTLSDPRMRISGVNVAGTDDPPLQLTLDTGDHELDGRILDNFSNAVAGARVSLVWAHEIDGITSHAARTGIADSSGYFRFAELGPGKHTLNVTAPGFRSRRIEHEVGISGQVQIVLQPR